ncbi:MAG TPA: transcription elongation factor GreA [Candidatus Paceibacterota bacterium]
MPDQKEYLSKEKHDELAKELDHLRKVRRKEVAEDLEYAKSLGDLSENAEYHEARELQANIEDRIQKLENILQNAEIMQLHHTEAVGIGSTVVVSRDTDGKEHKFEIVGSEEADVSSGKLSIHSPLGEAMLGKRKSESFSFKSPRGVMKYKVVNIE